MYRIIFILLTLIIWCDVLLAQCPMCKTSLVSSPEGQQMASAFNTGILFLLGAPFLVVAVFTVMFYWKRREWQRHRLQSGCDVSL